MPLLQLLEQTAPKTLSANYTTLPYSLMVTQQEFVPLKKKRKNGDTFKGICAYAKRKDQNSLYTVNYLQNQMYKIIMISEVSIYPCQ